MLRRAKRKGLPSGYGPTPDTAPDRRGRRAQVERDAIKSRKTFRRRDLDCSKNTNTSSSDTFYDIPSY
eukprot:scaffold111233_cov37-Tisochrysis_lutea.AAC.3